MFKCSRRQITGWVAIAAMLWAALAPTAAHALASLGGTHADWQQICSAQTDKPAELPSEAPPAVDEHSAHCPCCLLSTVIGAAPTSAERASLAPQGRLVPPRHEACVSRPRLGWLAPHSRAPPTLS